jgi:Domain of unknown function (DUF4190)
MVSGLVILVAVAALVILGLAAVIAGIVALVRINRSEGKLRGKGFAVAAIVIGLLLLLGLPVFGAFGAYFCMAPSAKAPTRSVQGMRATEEPGVRAGAKAAAGVEDEIDSP